MQNRQAERKRGCRGWLGVMYAQCADSHGPQFRLRSVRLSKHRTHSGAVGNEQTVGLTSTTSRTAALSSNAGHGCSEGRSPSLRPCCAITITSSLGERCQRVKRTKDRERPEQLVHPGLWRLPARESQREWRMCVHSSVRTS